MSSAIDIRISSQPRPGFDELLEDRLYEFNSAATGLFDGELLNAAVENAAGEIIAGLSGHTWGGCCEIARLWVDASMRGRGVGTALLGAAEREAVRRGCTQIVLTTHSFQAPLLYERLGYRRVAAIENYPRGHAQLVYVKTLAPTLTADGS
jgi:ribosomal protein S18 acetylase RimI-like enzyme